MAVKKIMNHGTRGSGLVAERKFHGSKVVAETTGKAHLSAKAVRRRSKVDHHAEEIEVIGLTEAELLRVDEVCSRNTTITEHVSAAVASPWKSSAI